MKEEAKLIEAALFISARAMSLEELRTLTGIGALGYLQSVVEELKKECAGRAIEISESEGKYEMRIKNEYLDRVKQFAQEIEISKGALRTLAYISKHDGIMKSELVKKIGSQIYEDVQELVESGFVKSQKAGRTSKLTLTPKFKKYFVQKEIPINQAGSIQQSLAQSETSSEEKSEPATKSEMSSEVQTQESMEEGTEESEGKMGV